MMASIGNPFATSTNKRAPALAPGKERHEEDGPDKESGAWPVTGI